MAVLIQGSHLPQRVSARCFCPGAFWRAGRLEEIVVRDVRALAKPNGDSSKPKDQDVGPSHSADVQVCSDLQEYNQKGLTYASPFIRKHNYGIRIGISIAFCTAILSFCSSII